MASIGSAIKRLRRRKGLSQQRIQEMTQGAVKAAWIASLETDRLELLSQKQIARLERLASVLDVTVFEILREAGLVEQPYPSGVSREERQLLNEFRRLTAEMRPAALTIIRDLRRATEDEVEPFPGQKPKNRGRPGSPKGVASATLPSENST